MTPKRAMSRLVNLDVDLLSIEARGQAMISIGQDVEGHDPGIAAAICQVARDLIDHARKLDRRRRKMVKALHPLLYPKAPTTAPANPPAETE